MPFSPTYDRFDKMPWIGIDFARADEYACTAYSEFTKEEMEMCNKYIFTGDYWVEY